MGSVITAHKSRVNFCWNNKLRWERLMERILSAFQIQTEQNHSKISSCVCHLYLDRRKQWGKNISSRKISCLSLYVSQDTVLLKWSLSIIYIKQHHFKVITTFVVVRSHKNGPLFCSHFSLHKACIEYFTLHSFHWLYVIIIVIILISSSYSGLFVFILKSLVLLSIPDQKRCCWCCKVNYSGGDGRQERWWKSGDRHSDRYLSTMLRHETPSWPPTAYR